MLLFDDDLVTGVKSLVVQTKTAAEIVHRHVTHGLHSLLVLHRRFLAMQHQRPLVAETHANDQVSSNEHSEHSLQFTVSQFLTLHKLADKLVREIFKNHAGTNAGCMA